MHIVDSLLACCWTYSPLNKYTLLVLLYQSKCFKTVIKLFCVFYVYLLSNSNLFNLCPRKFKYHLLIIKPTRCTNFSNLFLELNSACFRQFLCPSSGVFHCTHSSGICHTGLLTACQQGPDPADKLSANLYDIPLLCVQ